MKWVDVALHREVQRGQAVNLYLISAPFGCGMGQARTWNLWPESLAAAAAFDSAGVRWYNLNVK